MKEVKLFQECKDIYNNLYSIYKTDCQDAEIINYKDIIKKMFNVVNGKVIVVERTTSVYYDGSVDNYTIGGHIYDRNRDSGYIRLIEDLTMAYYRTHDGNEANNTYEFLSKLNTL